ncbi:waprin-like protein isoform X1 [Anopheles bellator]|uniref:waprin-like protein isoform X1 n=1 Tax=Anopheles bellator TaxID=139047 RepID=UPI0026490F6A|nr:waprin-like protein isoform X1 [Anopheles bellator]
MTKLVAFALCLALVVIVVECSSTGDCPLPSKVQSCSPKCLSDRDCSQTGGKCCSNGCNLKSCVERNKLTQSGDKYGSGSGSYCGSTKCSSFEKCGTDSATKKPKCVRA